MGKRTSDFVALAAIVGGAGLGLGLTSLFAQSRGPDTNDSSARVRVLRRSVIVEPGRSLDSEGRQVVHEAIIVEPEQLNVEVFDRRGPKGLDREQLGRLKATVEELRRETRELRDLERMYEAIEELEVLEDSNELEALENLVVGDLTIEFRRGDDDERRKRRRRRRPGRVAGVPNSDAPGN
jgi:hypothetical protein